MAVDKFEIGKIYKVNTVLSTDGWQMLNPGIIITILNIEEKYVWSRWGNRLRDKKMRLTFLHDNKIMSCQDYGHRLFTYFNYVNVSKE